MLLGQRALDRLTQRVAPGRPRVTLEGRSEAHGCPQALVSDALFERSAGEVRLGAALRCRPERDPLAFRQVYLGSIHDLDQRVDAFAGVDRRGRAVARVEAAGQEDPAAVLEVTRQLRDD